MAKINNKFLAQMATNTIKGNNGGSTANPLDLTTTQVTAMLNPFTSTLQGLVPSSGGGTTNYLRADGTWAVPPGTGGGFTVSSVSSNTNMSSGVVYLVTTSSTAITMTLPSPTSGAYVYVKDSTGTAQTNNITVSPHASETIDGTSSYVMTFNYGYAEFVSDGTNWFVTDCNSILGAWGNSLTWTVSATTASNVSIWYRRSGDSIEVNGSFESSSNTGSAATFNFPSGITINSSKMNTSTNTQLVGEYANTISNSATQIYVGGLAGKMMYDGATTNMLFFAQFSSGSSNQFAKGTGNQVFQSAQTCTLNFKVPITGWLTT